MDIQTKFDIGQIVHTLYNEDICKMRIVSINIEDNNVTYGLMGLGDESYRSTFKPEYKIFASRKELAD